MFGLKKSQVRQYKAVQKGVNLGTDDQNYKRRLFFPILIYILQIVIFNLKSWDLDKNQANVNKLYNCYVYAKNE